MRITVRGYAPLVLPPSPAPEAGRFNEHTSYVSRLLGELRKPKYVGFRLPCKILSLEFLKHSITPSVYYSEPLAGVGLTARVMGAGFEKLYLNDNSLDCLESLHLNFSTAEVTGADLRSLDFECGDLTFLDFNNFTFRRRNNFEEVLRYTFKYSSTYVILNDCTPFYFRYGPSSFEVYSKMLGLPIETVEDYFAAIAPAWTVRYPGWYLVAVGWFRDTSFQLFSRMPQSLTIRKFTIEDVPLEMIRIGE